MARVPARGGRLEPKEKTSDRRVATGRHQVEKRHHFRGRRSLSSRRQRAGRRDGSVFAGTPFLQKSRGHFARRRESGGGVALAWKNARSDRDVARESPAVSKQPGRSVAA